MTMVWQAIRKVLGCVRVGKQQRKKAVRRTSTGVARPKATLVPLARRTRSPVGASKGKAASSRGSSKQQDFRTKHSLTTVNTRVPNSTNEFNTFQHAFLAITSLLQHHDPSQNTLLYQNLLQVLTNHTVLLTAEDDFQTSEVFTEAQRLRRMVYDMQHIIHSLEQVKPTDSPISELPLQSSSTGSLSMSISTNEQSLYAISAGQFNLSNTTINNGIHKTSIWRTLTPFTVTAVVAAGLMLYYPHAHSAYMSYFSTTGHEASTWMQNIYNVALDLLKTHGLEALQALMAIMRRSTQA